VRRALLLVLGLVVSGGLVYLALRNLDLTDVRHAMTQARIWPWVPAAVATYLLGQVVRGWRCQLLVRPDASISLATATHVVVVGYAVNNVLPARLGELARAGMLAERAGLPAIHALGVTFLERLLDGLAILCLLVVAIFTLGDATWLETAAAPAATAFALATAAVAATVVAPGPVVSAARRLGGLAGPRAQLLAIRLAVQTTASVRAMRRPELAIGAAASSIAIWAIEAAMFWLILGAFDLPLRYDWALLAMAVTNLSVLLPSSPGHIGTFHYFCQQALISVGVAAPLGLAYATAVHLVFFVPLTLWGGGLILAYSWTGSWRKGMIWKAQTSRGPASAGYGEVIAVTAPPQPPRPPSRFLATLVRALIPKTVGDDDVQCATVVAFVHAQLTLLPAHLRLLLAGGLTGFRLLVILRYLRPFESIGPDRRRDVAAAWAYGPVAPARALFKAIRSTALLCAWEVRST
jgi:uncharacterized membrane protein YbhN (UPF0104 family)